MRSLHRKKGRQEEGLFLVEGVRSVEDVLRSQLEVQQVYISKTDVGAGSMIPAYDAFVEIPEKDMQSISALTTAPGILAVVKVPKARPIDKSNPLLLMDGLRDPGNLGTIIRTAHWFGVKQIVCSPDSVDVFNPKVVQATMGSIGFVNTVYAELLPFIDEHKDAWHFSGLDMEGTDIRHLKRSAKPNAVIIGSESHGISMDVKSKLDSIITIPPGNSKDKPESLNASIAAAIAVFQMFG